MTYDASWKGNAMTDTKPMYKVILPNVGRSLEAPRFTTKVRADSEEEARRLAMDRFIDTYLVPRFGISSMQFSESIESLIEVERVLSDERIERAHARARAMRAERRKG